MIRSGCQCAEFRERNVQHVRNIFQKFTAAGCAILARLKLLQTAVFINLANTSGLATHINHHCHTIDLFVCRHSQRLDLVITVSIPVKAIASHSSDPYGTDITIAPKRCLNSDSTSCSLLMR